MFTDFQNLSSHTAESPLKYALACTAQSPGVLEAGRQDGLHGYSKFTEPNSRSLPSVCLQPHLGNTVSRSLPMWFLPRDRGAQLRNPMHVCSLGCHRTRTPGSVHSCIPVRMSRPELLTPEVGCVYRLVMMRVRQPCSEQSEGDSITQNMNGSHLTTVWNI